MLALADMYMRRDAHGHYTNATDARVAVNCVDQPPITDRAKVDRRGPPVARGGAVHELRRVHRRRAAGHLRVLAGAADQQAARDLGAGPAADPGGVDHHDPATPYQAGVDLAKQLNGSLLTFNGTQHTVVFQGNSCVDDYATAYLVDGTTAARGAKC